MKEKVELRGILLKDVSREFLDTGVAVTFQLEVKRSSHWMILPLLF